MYCLGLAGFSRDRFLSDDKPPPKRLDPSFALATDDLMVFAQCKPTVARAAVASIDKAIENTGIEAHHGKDVDKALDCTIIGIGLLDECMLFPTAAKMASVLSRLAMFLTCEECFLSVLEMQTLLGHIAWFALLARPVFS